MNARDRELLMRAMRVNTELGRVTVELLHQSDGGTLPADGLRALGEHLASLGADVLARADELERTVIEG